MAIHQFLAGRFSSEFIKPSIWQKDLLKGNILLKHMPICSQLSFESAAIIGVYFAPNKEIFVDILGDPGRVNRTELLAYLKQLWENKINEFGRPPKDFSDLLMVSERIRILKGFNKQIYNMQENPDAVWDVFHDKGDMKIPAISFLPYLSDVVILEAFGCGLYEPELVEQLWQNSYETPPSDETINWAVKYNVLRQDEMESVMQPKPLKQRQTELVAIVQEYVQKHYPDQLVLLK